MAANSSKGGGIQWIPWGELTGGQKAARSLLILVVVVVFIGLIRAALNAVGPMLESSAPVDENKAALSEQDRKDGIVSLCKVFQIYGMPKNETEAGAAARNAAELFKLAGNRTADRNLYIFDSLAQEFTSKKLTAQDCANAGEPLEASSTAPPLDRP
jgi:hypothetical protein